MSLSNQLNFVTAVTNLRAAIGTLNVLKNMYVSSQARWDLSFDGLTGDHLIKGVMISSAKTDAIRIYVQTVVQLYLNSVNLTGVPLTKQSLSGENEVTVAIIDRIATSALPDNLDLFKLVASRLLGIDPFLVNAAVVNSDSDAAKALIIYLAYRSDEAGDPELMHSELIECFTQLYAAGEITETWYSDLIDRAPASDQFSSPLEALTYLLVGEKVA